MSQFSQGYLDDMLGLDTEAARGYRLQQQMRGGSPAEQSGAVQQAPSSGEREDDGYDEGEIYGTPTTPPPYTPPPRGGPIVWGKPNPAPNVPGGWSDEHTGGFTPQTSGNAAGYMDLSYWASRGVPSDQIFDFTTGQPRAGWKRTERGYEQVGTGTGTNTTPPPGGGDYTPPGGYGGGYPTGMFGGAAGGPNEGFQWPTYNAPRFSFQEFGGFKNFKPPTGDEVLNDPVLQAQLKEGNNRIKQDRAFRGILNTGDTLKDIFDWTSDRVKLGAHDAWDRSFKTYDINERQNPFNTWSANKGLALDSFDRNSRQFKDEFDYNQYQPAQALWKQNYDKWAKTGDWLATDNS